MRILLLGSGGREHAFAWKLAQDPECSALFIAPGNAGTATCGTNVPISPADFEAIRGFVLEHGIEMVVVGPEEPLVRGIVDYFQADSALERVPVVGPSAAGARLEGSKAFAKRFMERWGIPTASYREVTDWQEGKEVLRAFSPPYVLKADGLAAGKGVIILDELEAAVEALRNMLAGQFGEASKRVVIEQFLSGIEFSVFVLTDGSSYKLLPEAKDYKRVGEGDTGPNTGGMGAVSPVPFFDEALRQKVEQRIIEPTLRGLQVEGIPYKGFIFFGLMNVDGEPYVVEYNCRMGDPEAEVVLPRIRNSLTALFRALIEGRLNEVCIDVSPQVAATVVLTAKGYPGEYRKGDIIELRPRAGCLYLHAGTRRDVEGRLLTNGGRVIAITSFADDIASAVAYSLGAAEDIHFEGKYFRRDIGQDLIHLH
ncbi:MAG: phosphoribosylamine--glycine ligase [Saprospiraceae bacterium]|nr:phosphoribosylamine--glycine ligase [Saprospiraceae bacterium]MDW8484472.1 phosphoribosylamine--glycine ligase [Saprospiraceae bacterium]